ADRGARGRVRIRPRGRRRGGGRRAAGSSIAEGGTARPPGRDDRPPAGRECGSGGGGAAGAAQRGRRLAAAGVSGRPHEHRQPAGAVTGGPGAAARATQRGWPPGGAPPAARRAGARLIHRKAAVRFSRAKRESGGTGRRARLRISWAAPVGVRVPPFASQCWPFPGCRMAHDSSELKIAIEEPRAWARRLIITVPAERVARERGEVARRLAQRLKLPGFRKGRVPAQVLERKYGPAIESETVERIVGNAYREALRAEGLEPITQGSVEEVDYQPGSDLTFRVAFEIRPQIQLERLGGFQLVRERPEVRDE